MLLYAIIYTSLYKKRSDKYTTKTVFYSSFFIKNEKIKKIL